MNSPGGVPPEQYLTVWVVSRSRRASELLHILPDGERLLTETLAVLKLAGLAVEVRSPRGR